MDLKKIAKTILLFSITGSLSLCNIALADSIDSALGNDVKSESPQQEQLIVAVESTPEQPAVEKDAATEKKHRRFLPVFNLRGKVGVTEEKQEPTRLKAWLTEDNYATTDWHGLRTKLEDHGVTMSSYYLSDTFHKSLGGKDDKRALSAFGYVETNLAFDTKKLGLWPGGKFNIRYGDKHGMGLSRDSIGEFLGADAYDYRKFSQIEEYYYEQSMFSDRLKIKAGKQDASFDIAALSSGLNFIGNSFAYIPTNAPLPYYPEPALGTLITIKPCDWLSSKSGFYDGNPRGGTSGFDTAFRGNKSLFFVEELGVKHNLNNHPGNYFAGYFLHTAHKTELTDSVDARTYGQNTGMYLGGEQLVYKENKDKADDDQGLTMLGQFGWTPSDRNVLTQYYGVGAQYKGLIPNRDKDIVGIGTSIGKFSNNLQGMASDGRHGKESILEMFYKIQLNKWLAVMPDLQCVFHPNGKEKSSFLMGIRLLVTL